MGNKGDEGWAVGPCGAGKQALEARKRVERRGVGGGPAKIAGEAGRVLGNRGV